jgi:hypothetical protein
LPGYELVKNRLLQTKTVCLSNDFKANPVQTQKKHYLSVKGKWCRRETGRAKRTFNGLSMG